MQGILWAVIQQPAKLSDVKQQPAKQQPLLITPKYPLGKPHHITLQYGVNLKDWQHLVGKEFTATCLYEAWNSRIQCVAVSLPDSIPCANKHPHITVSWVNGATPIESNAMLVTKFNYQLVDLVINCKIEFYQWKSN